MGPAPEDMVSGDVLAGSAWECRWNDPGSDIDVAAMSTDDPSWVPATVPGTAAGALRELGRWSWGDVDEDLLDGSEWWYRCRFDAPEASLQGPWRLEFDGLATVADAWLNGEPVLHSENMWVTHQITVDRLDAHNVLLLRFAALAPLLAERRPRPRWRSLQLRSQNQRWYRTTLLGRVPGWSACGAPVGPWRPVRLHHAGTPFVAERHLVATCEGTGGMVGVRLFLEGVNPGTEVQVHVGDHRQAAVVSVLEGGTGIDAVVRVPDAERWWPHTHGSQPLYPVRLTANGLDVELGTVGFRTVEADRDGGAFRISVNGVPVFCRGAFWMPPDVVTLRASEEALRESLRLVVEGGMNMLRIGGYVSYEDTAFWDMCDELGILVWQDCMLAGFDPPEDPAFVESLRLELTQQLGRLQGHPSLAVVCGSSETHQQAAMFGLSPDRWRSVLLEETIPAIAAVIVPDVPYVVSSPSGGDLPFEPGQGVAHYFGVGAYLRPLADARTAGVRFAAECLSFGIPPEQSTVERCFGGATVAGHHPSWKAGVARDSGSSWDFEDVRDDYVRRIFGIDPFRARYADPERYLDLGRAVVAHIMSTVMAEWRCEQSSCAGALILSWHDLCPGAGWGLLDSLTVPKAPWYALRRVLAPVAVLMTDEGLAGLRVHVMNDTPSPVQGELRLSLYNAGGSVVEEAESVVEVGRHSEQQWNAATLLGGFRDLTNAYRFGPPAYDVVRVRLQTDDVVSEAFHLPVGDGRPQEPDIGLEAQATPVGDDWQLTVRTRRFAQWVALEVPGFALDDSWFHLAPGGERTIALRPRGDGARPKGRVRALNCLYSSPIVVAQ
ncbi:MAG: glycoside hydrolase family 2 protein [Acidimicrobiales bacterium]|jgi:beta-mannosidase